MTKDLISIRPIHWLDRLWASDYNDWSWDLILLIVHGPVLHVVPWPIGLLDLNMSLIGHWPFSFIDDIQLALAGLMFLYVFDVPWALLTFTSLT